ncbi:type II toxin-antitoxin system RelE/ParE family toxin [Neiella marina]|nr:type II toxin-antitoxin system YoeB family toxin [Neiella marina]
MNDEHRIVHNYQDETILIAQLRYHYGTKRVNYTVRQLALVMPLS